MRTAAAVDPRLGAPVGISVALHLLAAALLLVATRGAPLPVRAPTYRVDLVAAPPGPREIGVVKPPAATPPAAKPAPPPPRAQQSPKDMAPPATTKTPPHRAPPAAATPVPVTTTPPKTATPPQTAGGGKTGGNGTDVATVRTEGIEFPYPGYLDNIVRQIARNFGEPSDAAVSAEVMFLIRRDGSVTGIHFVKRSGNFSFDLEAQGAIEAAGRSHAFGPLPDGFADDVLPVIFSFDPRVLH